MAVTEIDSDSRDTRKLQYFSVRPSIVAEIIETLDVKLGEAKKEDPDFGKKAQSVGVWMEQLQVSLPATMLNCSYRESDGRVRICTDRPIGENQFQVDIMAKIVPNTSRLLVGGEIFSQRNDLPPAKARSVTLDAVHFLNSAAFGPKQYLVSATIANGRYSSEYHYNNDTTAPPEKLIVKTTIEIGKGDESRKVETISYNQYSKEFSQAVQQICEMPIE